jgi:hypothetical protein
MDKIIDISKIRIETARLLLRPFCEDDLIDFYEYASVPGVGEMVGWLHADICGYIEAAGFVLVKQFETEFAVIFAARKGA